MSRLATEFRARGRAEGQPGPVLLTIDETLAQAAALPPGSNRDDLLMGLAGVRLSLFPDEPSPILPAADADHPTPLLVQAA